MTLPFDLPPPDGYSARPEWDGQRFSLGGQYTHIIEYSENFSGWSDDLTALHEESAGDSHPIDVASRMDAVAQVKKNMPSAQAVIMEIGCSSGFLLRDLATSFREAVIIGADVVKEPLYKLAKTLPGIPLIRFDLLQCPLPDMSIDVLVMLNVLEHIDDDVKALQKAFGLLKPGGYLIIEVPAGSCLYDAYDAELHHFRRYSAGELQNKLTRAGFKVHRKSHLGFVLFPAFAAVKLLNKYFRRKKNKAVVGEQVASTSGNSLVKLAMEFESNHMQAYQLPFGIRTLMTAQRPT
jgi:trans-aconitate methyltransferase